MLQMKDGKWFSKMLPLLPDVAAAFTDSTDVVTCISPSQDRAQQNSSLGKECLRRTHP